MDHNFLKPYNALLIKVGVGSEGLSLHSYQLLRCDGSSLGDRFGNDNEVRLPTKDGTESFYWDFYHMVYLETSNFQDQV